MSSIATVVQQIRDLPSTLREYDDWRETKRYSLVELEKLTALQRRLRDAILGDELDRSEYQTLRTILYKHREQLHGLLSHFRRCPAEVITHIFFFAIDEADVDELPRPALSLALRGPLYPIAQVSRRFRHLILSNPPFFTRICLIRNAHCIAHSPALESRLHFLVEHSGSLPLHVTIRIMYHGEDYEQPAPINNLISSCSSLDYLKTKPWASFHLLAHCRNQCTFMLERFIFPPTPSTTSKLVELTLSTDQLSTRLLETVSNLPFEITTLRLHFESRDWTTEAQTNHNFRFPSTITHLEVTGSVISVVLALEGVPSIRSARVNLRFGTASLARPVGLPFLRKLEIGALDHEHEGLSALLGCIHSPRLQILDILWETWHYYQDIHTSVWDLYRLFFSRAGSLREVTFRDTPLLYDDVKPLLPSQCKFVVKEAEQMSSPHVLIEIPHEYPIPDPPDFNSI